MLEMDTIIGAAALNAIACIALGYIRLSPFLTWSKLMESLCASCSFITSFVTVFATVIAITKDLADVKGDLKYNIKTFATQLGVRGVAFLGTKPHACSLMTCLIHHALQNWGLGSSVV